MAPLFWIAQTNAIADTTDSRMAKYSYGTVYSRDSPADTGMSTGTIIGLVLGILIVIFGFIALFLFCMDYQVRAAKEIWKKDKSPIGWLGTGSVLVAKEVPKAQADSVDITSNDTGSPTDATPPVATTPTPG